MAIGWMANRLCFYDVEFPVEKTMDHKKWLHIVVTAVCLLLACEWLLNNLPHEKYFPLA